MKKHVYILLLLAFFFSVYKYAEKEQKTFVKNVLNDAHLLNEIYDDYSMECLFCYPKNRKDIQGVIDWFNKGKTKKISISENFNVKYDSVLKMTYIYSYGKNKKDDKLKGSLNLDKYLNQSNLLKSIFQKNDDFIVMYFGEFQFQDCSYYSDKFFVTNYDIVTKIQLFNNKHKERFNYKDHLKIYKKMEAISIKSQNKIKKDQVIWFTYIDKKVIAVCYNKTIPSSEIEKLNIFLTNYFRDLLVKKFDYMLFPVFGNGTE